MLAVWCVCVASFQAGLLSEVLDARARLKSYDVVWGSKYFTRCLAHEDEWAELRLGDEHGVVGSDERGTPVFAGHRMLQTRNLTVNHNAGEFHAMANIPGSVTRSNSDFRLLGLLPAPPPSAASSLDSLIRGELLEGLNWESVRRVSADDARAVYEADLSDGSVRWTIDSERGFNPVLVERFAGGSMIGRSESELELYGDTWFPKTVRFYSAESTEPYYTLRVTEAHFNTPDLLDGLGIEDLQLETGVVLNDHSVSPDDPARNLWWTPSGLVSEDQFNALLQSGGVEPGPNVFEFLRQLQPWRLPPEIHPWYEYTLNFIRDHQLTEPQKQRATKVYESCRAAEAAYMRRSLNDLHVLRDLVAQIEERPEDGFRTLQRLEFQTESWKRPIDAIFETKLKPELEKLLTREQRRAAERAEARKRPASESGDAPRTSP